MSATVPNCFTCTQRKKYYDSDKYYCCSGMMRFPNAGDCSQYKLIGIPSVFLPKEKVEDTKKITEGRTISADADNKVLRYWKLP
jgi:hypothetical protein